MKYIDADKLIAEIKHRIRLNKEMLEIDSRPSDWGRIQEGSYILRFIEHIQQEQPEVDLEKFDGEVTKIWGKCAAYPNDSIACLHIETFNEIAHHFYELGLNTRKEETK